jgi:hypothetical protein
MDLPDCPRCDANRTLEKIRADLHGKVWCYCRCCAASVLIDADGRVLHASTESR